MTSVVVRPRRIVIYASIAAAVVLGAMIFVGLTLHNGEETDVSFRLVDQLGWISVGVLGAAIIMSGARPRVRADEHGIRVRNIFGEMFFPWSEVVRIAFPAGSHWAQLVLPDDEIYPVLAIQAIDEQRAVDALQAVRRLHQQYRPAPTPASLRAAEQARRRAAAEIAAAASRPLGRLELIERRTAGHPRRRRGQ